MGGIHIYMVYSNKKCVFNELFRLIDRLNYDFKNKSHISFRFVVFLFSLFGRNKFLDCEQRMAKNIKNFK